VSLKYKLGFDDSLDVVGVHFVGGWIGSLSIGFFATTQVNSAMTDVLGGSNGIFYGGGATQLGRQFLGSLIVTVYSLVVAMGIAWVIKKTIGLRTSPEAELEGIDVAEHAESGYDLSTAGGTAGAFQLAGIGNSVKPDSSAPDEKPVSEKVSG
jgi:Amt family ammonium transporter